MNNTPHSNFRRWMLLIVVTSFVSPVFADKHGQHGHGDKHRDYERHARDREPEPKHEQQRFDGDREHFFNDHHRTIVRDYYMSEYRTGRCPPGLRKKANGCLPPAYGKRWVIGRALPRDVIYYDLPSRVIREIGYPPPGYRFVRVASDILMIAIGSGLVMDAIADLNGMP